MHPLFRVTSLSYASPRKKARTFVLTFEKLASIRKLPSLRETLIKSQSQISHGFLYIASSSSSLNSLLFASDDSSRSIKIQE